MIHSHFRYLYHRNLKLTFTYSRQDVTILILGDACPNLQRESHTMRKLPAPTLMLLSLACTVTSLTAATSAIGLATADGSFQVNTTKVWGNTTLFDGCVIETANAPSRLKLNNGARLRLATDSRATVRGSRLVLEKGSGQLESAAASIEARSLHIAPAAAGALARVQLSGSRQVLVAAVRGTVRVTNSGGLLVASLNAGNSLTFDPQAGAAGPTKISGCLLRKDGKLVVVDQTTNVTFEVQGPGLDKEVGNRVEISGAADAGSPSVAGASQLINMQNVTRAATGGCASVAKAAGADGTSGGSGSAAGGAAAATGIGKRAAIAIIGGVAAAGTAGGLAVAGTFSGNQAQPAASR